MKIKVLVSSIFLLITVFTFGQRLSPEERAERKEAEKEIFLMKKNTISVSPANIMFKQFQFSYERKFGNKNSFMLLASILHDRDAKYNSAFGYNFGLATELHYRKYIYSTLLKKKKVPSTQNVFGIYVAPFVGYQYLEREQYYEEWDINGNITDIYSNQDFHNAVQLGLVSGINLNLLKGRLSLDFYAGFAEKLSFQGGGYNPNVPYYYWSNPGILQFDIFGIIPKANMQVGFSF